jgi:2-alkyl-3-oxoalkanoate reductase
VNVLVTGATGFLGSHISERLVQRGERVRALVRPTSRTSFLEPLAVELLQGDVTDPSTLAAALEGIDTVYHAAALVSDWAPWDEFRSVTVLGTKNMLKAAREAGVGRFLYVSTDGVYRYPDLRRGVTEDSPLETRFGPFDYYRRSKTMAERIVRKHIARGEIPITIVRPALVLGERDAAMLPGLLHYLKSPGTVLIGRARNRLPIVYAGDVAELCILAAGSGQAVGETYNGVNEEYVTQRELIEVAAEQADVAPPKRTVPFRLVYAMAFAMEMRARLKGWKSRPDLTRFTANMIGVDFVESAAKAQRELGWKAEVGMREAVRRSVEWAHARRAQTVSG